MAAEENPAPLAGEYVVELILGEELHLRNLAKRLVRCQADVDDLVQDTLLRAIKARRRFQVGTSIRAWTSTILRRLFLTRAIRTRLRNVQNDSDLGGAVGLKSSRDLTGSKDEPFNFDPCLEHLSDTLVRALNRVPRLYVDAFILTQFYDLSCGEAGEMLGIPEGTVMSRVHRARVLLQADLRGRL